MLTFAYVDVCWIMQCAFSIVLLIVQVKVRLNLHGVVGVESVQQVDEEEYEEKVKRPVVKVCICACLLYPYILYVLGRVRL